MVLYELQILYHSRMPVVMRAAVLVALTSVCGVCA
jgi:hypothetical protein